METIIGNPADELERLENLVAIVDVDVEALQIRFDHLSRCGNGKEDSRIGGRDPRESVRFASLETSAGDDVVLRDIPNLLELGGIAIQFAAIIESGAAPI